MYPECLNNPEFEILKINISRYRRINLNKSDFNFLNYDKDKNIDEPTEDDDEERGIYYDEDERMFFCIICATPEVMPHIVGKGGQTKKRIEKTSGSQIIIQKNNMDIKIVSKNRISVESAYEYVNEIVYKNEGKYTHFISLPLREAKDKVEQFQSEVVRKFEIDKNLLTNPKKLHFTLCMLSLNNESEVQRCCELLKKMSPQIFDSIGTRSLVVDLKGVHMLNDDADSVNVIHTTDQSPDLSERINRLADVLFRGFSDNAKGSEYQRPSRYKAACNTC
eukprot:GHVL01014019.1.p1 GENE.GHVL01014019.1~~GHVL01014019.1.p1  ORF type:complete len:278 (+),score=65.33 GHVL01014019.1:61-894(+)